MPKHIVAPVPALAELSATELAKATGGQDPGGQGVTPPQQPIEVPPIQVPPIQPPPIEGDARPSRPFTGRLPGAR
jgi:hypothetical protein